MNAPEAPLRLKKRPRGSSRWGVLSLTISTALPMTAGAAMLRGSVSSRFATPLVTSLYSGPGGCTGCTSTGALGDGQETAPGTALSPRHASGLLTTSIATSLLNGLSGCTGCTSSEAQESVSGGTAKSQRYAISRRLETSTATSLYSSSLSDCTGCSSSDEAEQESTSAVATVSADTTLSPTRRTVSASTSSSATATLTSGGSDDSDVDQEDDDEGDDDPEEGNDDEIGDDDGDGGEDQSSSTIEVMTPANGEVICPENEIEVIWTWGEDEVNTFHVDLHDCGQDACCHDCGEFMRALCAEEGCHNCGTVANAESFNVPQDVEGTGPYYRIVVTADDGSYEGGCSGTFTVAGNVDTSGDDMDSHAPSSTDDKYEKNSTEDVSHETDTEEGLVVLGSCDSFDAIPYPLSEDMEVYVDSGVTELMCATPKTVRVGGGVLTIVATEETVVFGGIRFVVETAAVLLFPEDTATEFVGVNDVQNNGGIFNVAEDAEVDIHGPVFFQNNSVQATANGPHHGGAIYSQGSVRLRGGATFSDNLVSGDNDGHEAGDGGAVWNGPTARMVVGSTAILRSNAVKVGGRGGALWNEGFVEFEDSAVFALNQATSSGDDENDAGIGGGIFNREGLVRFKGNATFVGNYAQGGAAFVNSGEGKIKFHQDTSVVGNISNEEEGSLAGAVWNQKNALVNSKSAISFVGNRGYNAGAMLNEGEVTFRADVSVRENSAVMDGGGFINESGAKIVFYNGGDFQENVGNGSGGAILNFARLVFKVDEGESYTLNFKDNYCGDHECQDIHNTSGSDVSDLDGVEDLCEIGTQQIFG